MKPTRFLRAGQQAEAELAQALALLFRRTLAMFGSAYGIGFLVLHRRMHGNG